MINNLGPSGILAAPYVAYSACPNDAESILIEGLSDWILARCAMGLVSLSMEKNNKFRERIAIQQGPQE